MSTENNKKPLEVPKKFVRDDLRWVKITKDMFDEYKIKADSVNPNEETAKLALINKKGDLVYVISENKVYSVIVHNYSGYSRDYYTDEQEYYNYKAHATLKHLSNFKATPDIAKITSDYRKPMISLEKVLELEKFQNEFIVELKEKQRLQEIRNRQARIEFEKRMKIEEEQRKIQEQREKETRKNYPEGFQE